MSNRRVSSKVKPARSRAFRVALDAVAAMSGHTAGRWICNHHSESSDIEAYVVATDSLEIIAQTRHAQGINARANADFIVRAVNSYEMTQPIIGELVAALKLCLECDGLTWEAEHEAGLALARVEQKTRSASS